MTSATARALALLALASIAGCAPVTDEEIAASEQALTVCHTTVVEGVDVYEGQGNIDWAQVHASGREFAIARIADGNHIDSTFATNYAGIQAAGMVRGAYYFFRPQIAAATQATTILNAVGTLGPGDLPVTIDVECMCPFHSGGGCGSSSYTDCVSPATEHAVLDDVISMVAAGTGRMPMIYTGAWFWDGNQYLAGQAQYPSAPLWVSGYTSGCVTVPSGWTDWQIWQYNDTGTAIPGISGTSIDRNRWNGDLASLQAFAGMSGAPIYGAHYVSQSFPLASAGPLQIPQGGSVMASITLRNSGTADWDASTRLGTTGTMTSDRDRASIFVGPDWISPNRLAGLPAGMIVHPGEQFEFMWTFHVPDGTPLGMYDEHYGMVEEGTAWFGDPGQGGPSDATIEAIIEVTQGPDAGTPPPVDAGHDAATTMMTGDASHPIGDAAMTSGDDAGTVMGRPISGGCGCTTGGSSSNGGALLTFLVGLSLVVRRRMRA